MSWGQPIETAPHDGSLVLVRGSTSPGTEWFYLARWATRYSTPLRTEIEGWWESGGMVEDVIVYDPAHQHLINPLEWKPIKERTPVTPHNDHARGEAS